MEDDSIKTEDALENAELRQSIDSGRSPAPRVPWWMTAVIVAAMLPGLVFPWTLSALHNPTPLLKGLTWLYPAYVLVSGLLAWQCYGRRTAMSWIIIVLLLLTHLCFYYLTFAGLNPHSPY